MTPSKFSGKRWIQTTRTKPPSRFKPVLEPLEDRQLLSGFGSFVQMWDDTSNYFGNLYDQGNSFATNLYDQTSSAWNQAASTAGYAAQDLSNQLTQSPIYQTAQNVNQADGIWNTLGYLGAEAGLAFMGDNSNSPTSLGEQSQNLIDAGSTAYGLLTNPVETLAGQAVTGLTNQVLSQAMGPTNPDGSTNDWYQVNQQLSNAVASGIGGLVTGGPVAGLVGFDTAMAGNIIDAGNYLGQTAWNYAQAYFPNGTNFVTNQINNASNALSDWGVSALDSLGLNPYAQPPTLNFATPTTNPDGSPQLPIDNGSSYSMPMTNYWSNPSSNFFAGSPDANSGTSFSPYLTMDQGTQFNNFDNLGSQPSYDFSSQAMDPYSSYITGTSTTDPLAYDTSASQPMDYQTSTQWSDPALMG
jgi:hypothetical protein